MARLIVDPPRDVELRGLTNLLFEGGKQRLERFLAWGSHQGYFVESLDPALASLLFSGAQQELVKRLVLSPTRPDIEGDVRRAHAILLHGFLSSEMRPPRVA